MAFLGSLVSGVLEGGAEAGGAGALMGGVSRLLGGASSLAGNASNAELQVAMAGSEQDQVNNQINQMNFDNNMQRQGTWFNQMLEQKSQSMQQVNELRDVAMQQRKADDSITKEYIQSIKS